MFARSSLIDGGVNSHGGVVDLMGRRGFSLRRLCRRVCIGKRKGFCGESMELLVGSSGNWAEAVRNLAVNMSVRKERGVLLFQRRG